MTAVAWATLAAGLGWGVAGGLGVALFFVFGAYRDLRNRGKAP
jgi:hypothetical protein